LCFFDNNVVQDDFIGVFDQR
jgi:hypothetical protein